MAARRRAGEGLFREGGEMTTKKAMMVVFGTALALAPVRAQCSCGAPPEQPAVALSMTGDPAALERRVAALRWELHELSYTDTVSAYDLNRKRAEYEAARNLLRQARLAQVALAETVAKALASPESVRATKMSSTKSAP